MLEVSPNPKTHGIKIVKEIYKTHYNSVAKFELVKKSGPYIAIKTIDHIASSVTNLDQISSLSRPNKLGCTVL